MSDSNDRSRGWDGYRTFVVERKEPESETVTSFYLVPDDGDALPAYRPGQFLGFALDVPGAPTPVRRTYTISDSPSAGDHYRLSIKREPPPQDQPGLPPGTSSNYFHDHVTVGTRLQVLAPSGDFYLRDSGRRPVALLSGGVGLTPMVSMLNSMVENGAETPVWFVHGVRNGAEHAFGPHVRRLAEAHDNVNAHIVYLEPRPEDVPGRDYDDAGLITMEMLDRLLPGPEGDFYLCGPPPFMKALYNGLLGWGVAEDRILYEFFGPATVLKENAADPSTTAPGPETATDATDVGTDGPQVTFAKAGVTIPWDPAKETLLELAEAHGLTPDFSCRSGVCHTCMCRLVSGEVEYVHDDVFLPDEDDNVLICSSRPKGDVTLDV